MKIKSKGIEFFLILLLAFFFRFLNLNWDDGFHLHPDERFLTMVGTSMIFPTSFKEYLDPVISKLNPGNIGYDFYVYGTFPLIFTKALAIFLGKDNYNDFTILGRYLSASVDFFCVVLVYKIGKLLFQKNSYIPYFIAFFYAISVYPIQSAHFFTTDTFLNFFMLSSFYFILKFYFVSTSNPKRKSNFLIESINLLLSSLFFALALGSKISALYILPLNLAVIFASQVFKYFSSTKKKFKLFFFYLTFHFLFYIFSTYLFLRFFNPYYFQTASFFDLRLSEKFVGSIKTLMFFNKKDAWYPPGVQWINKPWYGLLLTTFLAGLGPINFMVMLLGMVWVLLNSKLKIQNSKLQLEGLKKEQVILFLILIWVIGYFVYQSLQFVKTIRYTIYLYPFYAVFGGVGIYSVLTWVKAVIGKSKLRYFIFAFVFSFFLILWPLVFFTIYLNKHTRVQASEWIYKNLPEDAIILGEHWDDPLPLPLENNLGKNFKIELLPIFDPDNEEKWIKMKNLFQKADYYVLSSNRGWGSIPTVPERYPIMSEYYKALLENDCKKQIELTGVCFKKIKEFLPFYYKFIRYPDSWIEETFTVYDHPVVMVYEKVRK